MRIFLTGMPGSGKSTIAKEFALLNGIDFYDTDALIEEKYHKRISEIFKSEGENTFRIYERRILKSLLEKHNIIVATGGGTACFRDNMTLMNDAGITVYLNVRIENLFQRLKSLTDRPLLENKKGDELKNYLQSVLTEREPYYLKSKYIVNADCGVSDILNSEPFNLKDILGI
ncbi:MAG: AAA family ATPase [Chlorobi bacterium]|nr:AAA family ATPase [Chlorobiota bacterium]